MGVSAYFKKEQMKVLQNFETFANIVSMALGGKKGKKKTADKVIDVQSAEQLDTLIRRQMNGSK